MTGSGWNPTSMPPRETQLSFVVTPVIAEPPPAAVPQQAPAREDEDT